MAGTRGIARLRGEQFSNKIMRNQHFDEANKISESYIDIDYAAHRDILEDTKIDVFIQVNDQEVAGADHLVVTTDVGVRPVSTATNVEGVVLTEKVQIRLAGTDSPIGDEDSDVVYGRLEESAGAYTLKFYSLVDGVEQPYTFDAGADNIDYRFVVRTNLSVIPVDAIIKSGAGFVEGATDAKAYMNLIQLMKDLYGGSGSLDNDGNANLMTPIVQQIANEVQDRTDADTAIRNDLVSTSASKGAGLVGVITDPNYTGITVQAVLINLASRLADAEGTIDRVDAESTREIYEALGGETEYMLKKGVARKDTMYVHINGQLQSPEIHYENIEDGSGNYTGINFAPDTLQVNEGTPDVLDISYKSVL
ncbi:hypothetical protein [Paenibacillus sp. NPDC057967]|uniref:hypothetical protein n=1 Tax=Paenibacillus sp. NPDC057967 TaxID=3346293 RepID=UPI0036DCAEC8